MEKSTLIADLQGTAPAPRVIVDRQTAGDIVEQILEKHRECQSDYDRIAWRFKRKDLDEMCRGLWQFCRDNFDYVVESTRVQYTSSPYFMLTHGRLDCKNYSLFIAGVLDSLRRDGYGLTWKFRFVSFDKTDPDPEHVFVIVNPATDDIWIDPVVGLFNSRIFYAHNQDYSVKTTASVGRLKNVIGTVVAENQILQELLEYQQGMIGAMQQTKNTSTLNTITQSIFQTISSAAGAVIPGYTQALALMKSAALVLDNTFGVGSTAARLFTDWSSFNFQGLWNDLFGRTYNTDQYWGAVFYKFYVLGQNITNQNQVSDSDVLPALKWFIDRTGVFISGREHIIALTQGSAQYLALYSVNSDTTTDPTLVAAAVAVAQKYWPNPNNFASANMGTWAATIGVFDLTIIGIANSLGETPEQYVAKTGTADQNAETSLALTTQPFTIVPGVPNYLVIGGAALLIIALIATSNAK